ncbi:PREDICTED: uncharacterized protein LOC103343998 isoform X3 [Prunus mume]|uniref:Uncharacterized protein LOC103343998 isoform X3 n=1 Tax=Prunus mume TaxID=102107 RepID=A0ABM0PWX3_PRUMU|nr:PREDICTED: uncharacterized protein LOC103343998 isoform X3 [Prunus mume]
MDFSNLSSLQRLDLGNNPICSLPNCIKGLARLDKLSFSMCTSLKSLLMLPKLNELDITNCMSLEKITYQYPRLAWEGRTILCRNYNLVEWEYMYKLQPIGSVEVETINLLGLGNLLESMAPIGMYIRHKNLHKEDPIPVQGLYQRGIFSTFFCGTEVPGQFSHKSRGSSISFTVPLLDNHRTRGLIVFVVYVNAGYNPAIVHHDYVSHYGIPGEGEDMIWLSHWKFQDDQLEGGDEVIVSVIMKSGLLVKELGIQLVQVQQEENHNMMSISTDSSYDDEPWFNSEDYDEVYNSEDSEEVFSRFVCLPDEEEEQHDDITVATTTGSNNSGGLRGWKVLVTAACFFLTLTLITRSSPSRRKKQPSTSPG